MNPVFLSNGGLGVRINATDASQRVELVGDGDSLVVTNLGDVPVYIRIGRADVVATTACYPALNGTKEDGIMLKGASGNWVAAICDSGQSAPVVFHRVSR